MTTTRTGPASENLLHGSRPLGMSTRRELERVLRGKGYHRGSADRWGDYWVSPDGRKRLYLDDSGAFFYLKKAGAWQRFWGRCWGHLILNDLMV